MVQLKKVVDRDDRTTSNHTIDDFAKAVCEEFERRSGYRYIKVRCDAIYQCVYFINKKNYFALDSKGKLVEKGTEGIRKDRCYLTKKMCQHIEREILGLPLRRLEWEKNGDGEENTLLAMKEYCKQVYSKLLTLIQEDSKDLTLLEEDNYTFGKHKFILKSTNPNDGNHDAKIRNEVIPKTEEYFTIFTKLLMNMMQEWMTDNIEIDDDEEDDEKKMKEEIPQEQWE
jgi:hypothetical protein